jgi:hypothetical protein
MYCLCLSKLPTLPLWTTIEKELLISSRFSVVLSSDDVLLKKRNGMLEWE